MQVANHYHSSAFEGLQTLNLLLTIHHEKLQAPFIMLCKVKINITLQKINRANSTITQKKILLLS